MSGARVWIGLFVACPRRHASGFVCGPPLRRDNGVCAVPVLVTSIGGRPVAPGLESRAVFDLDRLEVLYQPLSRSEGE